MPQRNEKVERAVAFFESHPQALASPGALSRALQMLKRPDSLCLSETDTVELLNRLDIPFGMGRSREGQGREQI